MINELLFFIILFILFIIYFNSDDKLYLDSKLYM